MDTQWRGSLTSPGGQQGTEEPQEEEQHVQKARTHSGVHHVPEIHRSATQIVHGSPTSESPGAGGVVKIRLCGLRFKTCLANVLR